MRDRLKIILVTLLLLLCVILVFAYTKGLVGKVVQWDTQQSSADDFSKGFPELSPSDLPQEGPLNTKGAIPEACNNAKEERDNICGKFIAEYPSGCHWWHFSFISSCNKRYETCKKLQQNALEECKIA